MLAADMLIINNKGEISNDMIELLQICTVSYDKLSAYGSKPEIHFTFQQNQDAQNKNPFMDQIRSIKDKVVENSKSSTIEKTAEEMLGFKESHTKVFGFAFQQLDIQKDDDIGLKEKNSFRLNEAKFGNDTAEIYKHITKLLKDEKKKSQQKSLYV